MDPKFLEHSTSSLRLYPERENPSQNTPLFCTYCTLGFEHEDLLNQHVQGYHGLQEKPARPFYQFTSSGPGTISKFTKAQQTMRDQARYNAHRYRASNEASPRVIITPSRSQTPGEATVALPMGQLSLVTRDESKVASGTRRKRAATSEMPQVLSNQDLSASDHAQQPVPSSAKRACGAHSPNHLKATSAEQQCPLATPATSPVEGGNRMTADSVPSKHVFFQARSQKEIVDSQSRPNGSIRKDSEASTKNKYPGILSQPESRPITSDQLAVEVKNIYSTLVAMEAKCISLDNTELASSHEDIDAEDHDKWQTMLALHRSLLYEHHDFLSASQHPYAHDPLKRLALKYSMPARMWKHGIHSFLEVLRRRLPYSMDYMLQFIYIAYQMIALLFETVEAFRATWIECLGDLARYRMAIEDGVQRDRETWGMVAHSWYSTASDINPQIGRLYHHLGILARPNAVQQLCYYSRALTCVEPFANARESLSALLISAFESRKLGRPLPYVHEADAIFLYLHAIMFMESTTDDGAVEEVPELFQFAKAKYLHKVEDQMNSLGAKWKTHGVFVAIANITACFRYGCGSGKPSNPFMLAFENGTGMAELSSIEGGCFRHESVSEFLKGERPISPGSDVDRRELPHAEGLLFSVFRVALCRKTDSRMLPHVHVLLVFIRSVAVAAKTCFLRTFLELVPWMDLVAFLNSFAVTESIGKTITDDDFPEGCKKDTSPLPEDYSLRGEVWVQNYFTERWFGNAPDHDTRYLEQASTDKTRLQRVLWLGVRISKSVGYIDFHPSTMLFSIN